MSKRGGRRKRPQPGKTVAKVIVSSLLALGLATGLTVVLVYNNWNGNLERQEIADQLRDRPEKETPVGPQEPLNILVMGSDSRSGKGNKIDGEAGGGLSDTTILFHVSANREFAYGISVPRDTAVIRPTCYRKDGSEITAAGGYSKWNAAFAVGGPACTVQQFEQVTRIRVDNYVVVDFNQFKDMVNALGGVEVCVPQEINDTTGNIHLKAGTRVVMGDEALDYARVRYGISDGIDPNRTRRQQAFIGSMMNKAMTAGMLTRPDKLVGFMNAATSSVQTDFDGIAQMADIAVTGRGIGADNIKFITPPWRYSSDLLRGSIAWTEEIEDLWRLVRRDRPLTPTFLQGALSAGDAPDGSSTAGTPGGPRGGSSAPSDGETSPPASGTASPDQGTSPGQDASTHPEAGMGGLSPDARADAGLCS